VLIGRAALWTDVKEDTDAQKAAIEEGTVTKLQALLETWCSQIDKYLGDGLLSVFPDAGDGPVRAAVEMLRAVDLLSETERATLGISLDIGIGIHRGTTILGLVGAQDRLESTVISDAVNVASRLERLTRTHDARIIASASVLPASSPLRTSARSLGRLSVRGKRESIECFDVFAADAEEARARKAATPTDPVELDPQDAA
jgi:two-component system sensor histidine kinase ChiS